MSSSIDIQQTPSLADFQLLAEVSQLLTVTDLDATLSRAVELTTRAVGATKASLFLHHQHSSAWQRLLTARELDPQERLRVVESVMDRGLAGWVLRNREAVLIADTQTDERWITLPNDTSDARSVLCVPLMHDNHVMAVLTLSHPSPDAFNEHQLRLLTIIANQVTVAVRNAQLFYQMQEQGRQLEAVLHAIPDVLLVIGHDGALLLANDSAAVLLGAASREELSGLPLAGLLERDSTLTPLAPLAYPASEIHGDWSYEARSETQRRDFMVTVSAWRDALEGAAGYVVVMRDITQMRDLSRFKGEMLRLATHDLRSPLSLIIGYCDLIEMDVPAAMTNVHDYLEVIRRSTRRMNGLLDDMLRVDQVRTSPLELHQAVNFGELVESAADSLQLLASTKNQQVGIDVPHDLPQIVVDPVLVREAMDNLTSNAVKYTPAGGRITIRAGFDGSRVLFEVEDTGMGISPDDLPRVYESFFRARQSGEVHVEGHGLGLSLVKTIVERHGGQVWVESELSKGSRFGFWLPV